MEMPYTMERSLRKRSPAGGSALRAGSAARSQRSENNVRMEILAGEELKDYFRVQDAANKLGARLSGETYKAAYDMGEPPVLLLIGADVSTIVEAPCKAACPAGIDVPRYIRLIGDGQYDQAAQVVREKVPFLGLPYVCRAREQMPPEAPWESAHCDRGPQALRSGCGENNIRKPSVKPPASACRHRVQGAGLTAAYYLRKVCGHEVTVFEALSQSGGMMRVGIPQYRLPRELLDREIQEIKSVGVDIKTNTRVDSLDELFGQGYDAVLVAVGTHEGQKLPIAGADLDGCW
jgi:hypothetical protein